MLRDDATAFLLVSSAETTHLDDARALAESIAQRGVELRIATFNRSYERLAEDDREIVTNYEHSLLGLAGASATEPGEIGSALEMVEGLLRRSAAKNARAQTAVAALRPALPSQCMTRMIPWLDHDIRDLDGLVALGPYLE